MKTYKVVTTTEWWTNKNLARKIEKAINEHTKDGWNFEYVERGVLPIYNAMIVFSKKNDSINI
tara:strand:- start:319 stop:507 length:189 start_codon:yes stop_codon:yes gene_type:complete